MSASYAAAIDRFTDGMARICGIYGMNPLYGRLYGVLLLSPEPLPLEDLAARAGAAKSTVSVAIRKLVDARAVHRSSRKGDRRDWYEASADPEQVMRDLLERYVRPEIDIWRRIGRDAASAIAAAEGEDWPSPAARGELARRLTDLEAFLATWERALAVVESDVARERPPRRVAVDFAEPPAPGRVDRPRGSGS